jgi:hypothetical protein
MRWEKYIKMDMFQGLSVQTTFFLFLYWLFTENAQNLDKTSYRMGRYLQDFRLRQIIEKLSSHPDLADVRKNLSSIYGRKSGQDFELIRGFIDDPATKETIHELLTAEELHYLISAIEDVNKTNDQGYL